jgi:hypothetical protein
MGDSVLVSTPHEHDGVTDRSIESEGNVTEDTLGWCDDDCMGSTTTGTIHGRSCGGHVGSHGAVRGHAFYQLSVR